MIRLSRLSLPCTIALTLSAAGCSWHDPSRVEEDFGKSVRLMVAEQIHDPQTASDPAAFAPDRLDGDAAVTSVEGYRGAARQARVRARDTVPETGFADIADAE